MQSATEDVVRDSNTAHRFSVRRTVIHKRALAANSNIPLPKSHAIESRFKVCIIPEADNEGDRSISRHKAAESLTHNSLSKTKGEAVRKFRFDHAIIFMVYKLISCFVIKDVEMSAYDTFIDMFENYIKDHGGVGCNVFARTGKRFRSMVMTMTILYAIQKIYHFANAPFKGNPFKLRQLLEIEQHLFASFDICVFVAGIMADEYEDPSIHEVIAAIAQLHEAARASATNLKSLYKSKVKKTETQDEQAQNELVGNAATDFTKISIPAQNQHILANMINTVLSNTSSLRYTEDQVNDVLTKLRHVKVYTQPYTFVGDNFHELPVAVKDATKTKISAVERTYGDSSCFYFPTSLVDPESLQGKGGVVLEAIQSVRSKFTPRRTMVLGKAHTEIPNLLYTIQIGPTDALMSIKNPYAIYENSIDYDHFVGQPADVIMKSSEVRFTQDIDVIALTKRNASLGIPITQPHRCAAPHAAYLSKQLTFKKHDYLIDTLRSVKRTYGVCNVDGSWLLHQPDHVLKQISDIQKMPKMEAIVTELPIVMTPRGVKRTRETEACEEEILKLMK